MRTLSKTLLLVAVILTGVFLIYSSVNAVSLVPCGRLPGPGVPVEETKLCGVCDILSLASRIINFVLFTLVPAIAVLLYLIAGFMILLGGANPGWVATGTSIFKTTTWGVIIIFASWMITNSVLKSIAGNSLFTKDWNKVTCTEPVSGPPPTTTKYVCGSTGCVANANPSGQFYTNPTCGGACAQVPSPSPSPTVSPTTSPAALACIFQGVNYSTFNICSGLSRPGGCGTASACSQFLPAINRYANGVATANILKTFMVIESDCNPTRVSYNGTSFGLMQFRPATANQFKSRCGITLDITPSWLTDPANAEKSICLAAAYINSIAAGSCGAQPGGIYAGYNAGPGWCNNSVDCSGQQSCSGGPMKQWECPFNNPQQTVCNTGLYQTKQGAAYTNYCMNNLGF